MLPDRTNVRLFYRVTGSGFPLVILHGLFGSSNNWNSLARRFGDFFTVYTLDLRNHGHSPHHPLHTYPAMAEDVAEFVRQESIESLHLLGHSMGGKVAMEFALTYPSMVRKLVVADIAPVRYQLHHDTIFDALTDFHPEEFQSRTAMDLFLKAKIPDDRVRGFLLTNIRRTGDGAFAWTLNLAALYENRESIDAALLPGRQFTGPTLFIRGERSDYLATEHRAAIEQFFPHAQVTTIGGAGHWLHADAPDRFLELVREFLSSPD